MMRLLLLVGVALCGCSSSTSKTKPIDAPIDVATATSCTSCDPSTQFCYQVLSGVRAPADPVVGCNALPAACTTTRTCACLTANATAPCGSSVACSGEGSQLTLTCVNP